LLLSWALSAVGCHALRLHAVPGEKPARPAAQAALVEPGRCSQRVGQFLFLSDFELKPDLPLFQDLEQLGEQVYQELQLPVASTLVKVYLFETRERYDRFMRSRYPDLPERRAFFVAQPRNGTGEDLMVYTYWGERIREDLRHELTHALLHGVLKDVPLWLDEGLAEYFELPPERQGVNGPYVEQMRRDGARPDLARLEQLGQVAQMNGAEYREAWAWVHLMLRGSPEGRKVLLRYVHQLRSNPSPGALRPRLAIYYPKPEEALERHLAQLETRPASLTPTAHRLEP
jgi:hypothetical protein